MQNIKFMQIKSGKEIAKKGLKQEKGITLIALVITIIVLLILAGVAIATLSGENGILRRAGEASENNKRQSFIEQAQLAVLNAQVEANATGRDEETAIMGALRDYFDLTGLSTLSDVKSSQELTPKAGYGPFTTAISGIEVLGKIATAGGGGGGGATGSQPTASDYGDIINYNIDISSENSGHIDGWKILYANSSGTYIISADYVSHYNEHMTKPLTQTGMQHGNVYNIFWQGEPDKPVFGNGNAQINDDANYFMYNWNSGGMNYANKIAVAALLKTDWWDSFLTTNVKAAGGLAIGAPTIELFRASWNEKQYEGDSTHTKVQISPDTDYLMGYYIGLSNDDTYSSSKNSINVKTDAAYNDLLYFPHIWTNNSNKWQGIGKYWIASPSSTETYSGDGTTVMYVGGNGNIRRIWF